MQSAALSPKRQRFVDLYLVSGNATDAYVQAFGCERKGAEASASRLLRVAKVASEVARRQGKAAAKAELTLAVHLARLNELADKAVTAEQFSAAVSAEVSRGKASGFYVERTETKHSGKVEVRVRFEREGRRVTAS